MNLSFKSGIVSLVAVVAVGFLFQNCGKGFEAISHSSSGLALERFDIDCVNNNQNQACIYYKNPLVNVDYFNIPLLLEQVYELANLQRYQTYAVRLDGLISRNQLSSNDFSIYDEMGTLVTTETDWNVPYSPENEAKIGQISTYFYAQKANQFFYSHSGTYLYEKGIRIVTDTNGTGWSSSRNTLYLEKTGSTRYSMDGGVVVHLMGEVAISHATSAQIYNLEGDAKHVDCGSATGPVYAKDCCSSQNGCSKAVTAGLSDYLVSILFPQNQAVGEHIQRSLAGAALCTTDRNLETAASLTAADSYQACGDTYRRGQVFYMGKFYGSIWNSIRNRIQAENPKLLTQYDRLYVALLSQLTGDDDFMTVLEKVKALDQQRFKSVFSPYFDSEYSVRGLASL